MKSYSDLVNPLYSERVKLLQVSDKIKLVFFICCFSNVQGY